jgi:hypothetical protein
VATTKVKKPNEKQLAVLKVLTPARIIRVEKTENRDTKKTKTAVKVTTLKGTAVDVGELKVTAATVAQLEKAGWVSEYGAQGGSVNDVYTEVSEYQITEEGKKARKAS